MKTGPLDYLLGGLCITVLLCLATATGVSLGEGAVLAPDSVATVGTVIPDGELWGGNPARPIRR